MVPESKTLRFLNLVKTSILWQLSSLQTWTKSTHCEEVLLMIFRPSTRCMGLPDHQGSPGFLFTQFHSKETELFPVESSSAAEALPLEL